MSTGSNRHMRDALVRSPSLFPFELDPACQSGHFIHLSASDYASASFLDNRVLRPGILNGPIPWSEVQQAASELDARCDFIFHISHVGSTLISRLLGLIPQCFAVREPILLRRIAVPPVSHEIETLLKLWSRTFSPDQRALIKATSFISEHAADLMQLVAGSRALLIYIPLESFLAALLDGAMSDIAEQLNQRLLRVHSRGLLTDLQTSELTPGQAVAVSWLAEMLALHQAATQFPGRCHWLNFEQYLECAPDHLAKVVSHFGLQADVTSLLRSPLVNRYSKRPEVQFNAQSRQQLLAQSQSKFSLEISRGLDLLSRDDLKSALAINLEIQSPLDQLD